MWNLSEWSLGGRQREQVWCEDSGYVNSKVLRLLIKMGSAIFKSKHLFIAGGWHMGSFRVLCCCCLFLLKISRCGIILPPALLPGPGSPTLLVIKEGEPGIPSIMGETSRNSLGDLFNPVSERVPSLPLAHGCLKEFNPPGAALELLVGIILKSKASIPGIVAGKIIYNFKSWVSQTLE